MKIDDPRLEKARKEMAERVEKYNALLLSVIKTHLVVEQAMDGLLAAALFHPEYIRETQFNFAHKMKICQAMALTDNEDKLWRVLGAFNSLRNKLAHTTQIDEIRSNMDQLRKVYLSSLTGKQVEMAYCVVPGSSIFSAGDMDSGLILAAVFRAADASRRIPVAVFLLRGALRSVTFPFRGLARPMKSQ